MDNNYWEEYWDSYYEFIDFYINKLQNIYQNEDIEDRYIEVAKLFEPSIRPNNYVPPVIQTENQLQWPGAQLGGIYGPGQGMQQGNQGQQLPPPPPWNQGPGPAISPGGGQFIMNNCKKMSVVKIVMRSGFNPSNFYMLVDFTDRRSIQGYRIAYSDNRIRFVPISVEYRNINFIECVF